MARRLPQLPWPAPWATVQLAACVLLACLAAPGHCHSDKDAGCEASDLACANPALPADSCLDPDSEQGALLCIKAQIDSAGVLESWRAGVPQPNSQHCKWRGVTCDAAGRVVRLALGSLQLRGSLPGAEALQALEALQTLDLSNTSLSGTLPPGYSALTQLVQLHLWGNAGITGSLPREWAALSKLQRLYIYATAVAGTLPPEWGSGMAAMRELDLGGTIARFCDAGQQLSGPLPKEWAAMANLERLEVSCNQLTGSIPAEFGNSPRLRKLYAAANKLSGTLPDALAGAKQLNDLLLYDNQLTGPLPVAWKALTQLDLLSLGLNKLTGTLPHAWAKLTGLTILYLGENAFTGTLPKSWGKGLGAKLRDFQAANNQLSGTIPPEFGALSGLQIAALANNSGLTGCLPVQWKAQVNQPESGFSLTDLTAGTQLAGFCDSQ